jgi:hypothetical protein
VLRHLDIHDGSVTAHIVALPHDWRTQARSMRAAGLPRAFTRINKNDSSVPDLLEAAGLAGVNPWPHPRPTICRSFGMLYRSSMIIDRLSVGRGQTDGAPLP